MAEEPLFLRGYLYAGFYKGIVKSCPLVFSAYFRFSFKKASSLSKGMRSTQEPLIPG